MTITKLCVIGVGLIGGSLALALKKKGLCAEVVGYGRGLANLQQAVELGVIDRFETDLAAAVADASHIVVSVPLGQMATIFQQLQRHAPANAIITDVGSAKECVVIDARAHLGDKLAQFVPAHPIAGTEKSGACAAFPTLFENRKVIITPIAENSPAIIAEVSQLWQAAGASVVSMDVVHHDEVLAATSHLPHLLAYSLVDTLASMNERREVFEYAAGGFRDFTRIASSDPQMWHDICLANRDALLKVAQHFDEDLQKLIKALENQDSAEILRVFRRAKQARDDFMKIFT